MDDLVIADRHIGPGQPPFIVAEMSANHNHSLERALQIVEAAAAAGAHGLKLQTYHPDTITLNLNRAPFIIDNPHSLWNGRSLYDLYTEAMTPWEWHQSIMDRARELELICFSTPFDNTAVDFLEGLDVPCYKIASFEMIDLQLVKYVAATGKPMIVSTGMASAEEIQEMIDAASNAGCRDLILLKCTSSYPASPVDSNLLTISDMRKRFGRLVGLSDHTGGIGAALASVALGAVMIEKHFTLSRADGGPDAAFSIEPDELRSLVEESLRGWQALGRVSYERSEAEERSTIFRRSLFVAVDVQKGEQFTEQNVRSVRPSDGLPPKHLPDVLGRRASRDIAAGTPLAWDLIE